MHQAPARKIEQKNPISSNCSTKTTFFLMAISNKSCSSAKLTGKYSKKKPCASRAQGKKDLKTSYFFQSSQK